MGGFSRGKRGKKHVSGVKREDEEATSLVSRRG